jgi:hypothetical protein
MEWVMGINPTPNFNGSLFKYTQENYFHIKSKPPQFFEKYAMLASSLLEEVEKNTMKFENFVNHAKLKHKPKDLESW